jgi:RNA polymerase sigma-70 factor (ECF subfamily)
VYRYLRATLRNGDDAQEVTQLVFLRALEKIKTCRMGSDSFASWLYGIARNAGIDHLRGRTRTAVEEPAAIDRRRDGAESLEAAVEGHWDARVDVHAELQRLPEAQRMVIVLRYLVGLDAAEIGEVIGCTADSVRHFHQRALRALRRGCTGASLVT